MGGDEEKHEAFEEIAIQLSIFICNFAAMIAKRLIGIIVVGAVVLLTGRIHAQSAVIFNHQILPRSQLQELILAEKYAWKGKDSLQTYFISTFTALSPIFTIQISPLRREVLIVVASVEDVVEPTGLPAISKTLIAVPSSTPEMIS